MPRVCAVTGKKTSFGNKVARRGLAKKKGGVGIKTTGITARTYKPNLQKIRIVMPDGGLRTLRVAASVIKKGYVTVPFKGTTHRIPIVRATRGRNKRKLQQLGRWQEAGTSS